MSDRIFDLIKEMTGGQLAALVKACGGVENVHDILAGRKSIRLEDVVTLLFDQHGRRIPPMGMKSSVVDANRAYHFMQPEKIDYAERLVRMQHALGIKKPIMTAAQFEDQAGQAREQITQLSGCSNIFNGTALPVCAPPHHVRNIGRSLDRVLLPAVERAYLAQFPEPAKREFRNWRHGELAGQVTIVPDSRYGTFLVKLKASPLIWWHFPASLQGYSIPADCEQMSALPGHFILAGPVSTSFAFMMYSDVLARDNMVPASDCAAVQWQGPGYSLCLGPDDAGLFFGSRSLDAIEFYSGGLLVPRQCP